MRWIPSTWLLCAALVGLVLTTSGCEDDPDDLAHLRDAGTSGTSGASGTGGAPAPDAAADEDAGE